MTRQCLREIKSILDITNTILHEKKLEILDDRPLIPFTIVKHEEAKFIWYGGARMIEP